MKRFSNFSFKQKLASVFFAAGILPMVLSFALITCIFKNALADESDVNVQLQFNSLRASFENFLDSMDSFSKAVGNNEKIYRVFENDQRKNLAFQLNSEIEILQDKGDFAFYTPDGKCIYSSAKRFFLYNVPLQNLQRDWGILHLARNSRGAVWLANPENDSFNKSEEYAFQVGWAVRKESKLLGFAVISVTKNYLDKLFEGKFNSRSSIFVGDRNFNRIFSSAPQSSSQADFLAYLKKQFFNLHPVRQTSSDGSCFIARHEKSGFYFVMHRQFSAGMNTLKIFVSTALITLFIIFLLFAFSASVISRSFFEPIQNLNNAMILVEKGNLDIELKTRRIDELGQLIGRFNRTVRKLKQYMNEILDRQKDLNSTQIRMMQAQLNPHFLYNTLDTVKWIAKINKINTIATITTDLADILRFAISGDDVIPLEEELNLLERYVEIQKIRFPDKFVLNLEIEDNVRSFMIPKLMLQPLVENSIIHGFEEVNKGVITIKAEEISDNVVITVSDDGKGISQKSINDIQLKQAGNANQADYGGKKGHLGLHNVDAILRLHFGQKSGLHFIPMKTNGTCIRIIIPKVEK